MPILVAILVAALLGPTAADAASLRKRCKRLCGDAIAACLETTGRRKAACRKQTLRRCRREGLAACAPPATTTTTTIPAGAGLVTIESLAPAVAALRAGATDVALTEDGRLRLVVTAPPGGFELRLDGEPIAAHDPAAGGEVLHADYDRDGEWDWDAQVTRGSDGIVTGVVIVRGGEELGAPVVRQTWTLDGEALRVVVEEGPRGGPFAVVDDVATSIWQGAGGGGRPRIWPFDACGGSDRTTLDGLFTPALRQGLQCLERNGLAIEAGVLRGQLAMHAGSVRFDCVPLSGLCAQVSLLDGFSGGLALPISTPIVININSAPGNANFFSGAGCAHKQAEILFHELLHLQFGPHIGPPDRDRTQTCGKLCFDPANVNRCQCAGCLDTDACDARCAAFASCGETCSTTTTTSSTTTTTSTTVPPYSIQIRSARCDLQACVAPGNRPGTWPLVTVDLTVTGPVGAMYQTHPPAINDGVDCSPWIPKSYISWANPHFCERTAPEQPATLLTTRSIPMGGGFCSETGWADVGVTAYVAGQLYSSPLGSDHVTLSCH